MSAPAGPVGCASRARPAASRAADVATPSLAQGLDTFLMARAGDDLQVLALSGGGQNGAFGAGVLEGWRGAGRPRFDVVTGISTGAVQATFAFLGTPADDEVMHRTYTTMTRADVLCMRTPLAVLGSTSVADFRPLERTFARLFDDATIDRVAGASEDGRRMLLVATANLDSGRLSVWDLGAVARAHEYDRYRSILRAAASPPVLADPVLLDGDFHADANLIGGVFVPDPEAHLGAERLAAFRAEGERRSPGLGTRFHVHVVLNALVREYPERVPNALIPLGYRSLHLLVTNATHGSLWYLYGMTQRRGATFHFVAIPEASRKDAEDGFAFDPAKTRALFEAGLEAGRRPATWADVPPRLAEDGN